MATVWRVRTYRERRKREASEAEYASLTFAAASVARVDSRIGGGGSLKYAVALQGAHTPSKNLPPISGCKHTSLISLKVVTPTNRRFTAF